MMALFNLSISAFLTFYFLELLANFYETTVAKIYVTKNSKDKNNSSAKGRQHNDMTILAGFRSLGKFCSLPIVGVTLQYSTPQTVFGMMFAFPLILIVFAVLMEEQEKEFTRGKIRFWDDLYQVWQLFRM